MTSLYRIVQGKPPQFFDGNEQAFTGLYFNLEDETLEFYGPLKMKANPLWISVTELMQTGVGAAIQRLFTLPDGQLNLQAYLTRLNAIETIKDIDLHIEEVTGEGKTVDVVVDIFFERKQPGSVASHWIPMDRRLWQVENYHAFLAARRDLLAQAANTFLESLR